MRTHSRALPFSRDADSSSRFDRRLLCGAAIAGVVLFGLSIPRVARAQQLDTNPPVPNVLLMIDNSGSMERMIDGSLPEALAANTCNCIDNGLGVPPTCNFAQSPPPVANRWNGVQQALTGTLQNGFNCIKMPRDTGSTFASEYQIAGIAPYDTGYYLPFHRMVANDSSTSPSTPCVVAPGKLPGAASSAGVGPTVALNSDPPPVSATAYAPSYILNRQYGTLSPTAPTCNFAQLNNGAIDSMTNFMRFGLMTFDQDPSAATGVSTGPPFTTAAQPFAGMWSYFPGWDTGAACTFAPDGRSCLGNPVNCAAKTMMAVGARNPAAPPWEGRLVYFPPTNDLATQNTNNLEIQRIVLASRPYGATPLAGMFTGAQYFFWTDPKGPQPDPLVQGGCRNQYIILLTDGAPNLDMQTACSAMGAPNGVCPFPLPQTTAATLYNNGHQGANQFVSTFVIGFAVSTFSDMGVTAHCTEFATNGPRAAECSSTNCSDPSLPQQGAVGTCCELQCIARNGGTNNAYFADTQGDLQKALTTIMGIIAKNATTRTVPAFSQVATNVLANQTTPQTNASIFLASFNPSPGKPWSGDIQRQRYQCTINGAGNGYTVPSPTIVSSSGDDFGMNLNSNQGPARRFIAFQVADSTATIRPYYTYTAALGDKLGLYSATTRSGSAASVVGSITSAAFGSSCASGYQYTSTSTGATVTMSAALCATMNLDYLFGQATFAGQPADFAFVSRFGSALGDIYHATPAVVGPPGGLLQDPTYVLFRSAWGSRKQVVYAPTNDGLLHAFWADETTLENNEMWAMAPPAVLPNVAGNPLSSHNLLLDGAPVVRDVVWDRNATTTASNTWHTMLVAGYGSQGQGYYAVDVTNPDATSLGDGIVPPDAEGGPAPLGPVFRWQLTKLPSSTYQVFGRGSATPAITTLFMDPGDGGGTREIGVAILPGGKDGPPTSANPCARKAAVAGGTYAARGSVRCWGTGGLAANPVNGRSLSIVRIDTGEIIRVFARGADVPGTDPLATASRIIDTPLDSPMTGTPLVFPPDVGADASKIFVGDEDGTLWRFDVSSSIPSNWTGALFLDLYNPWVDTNAGGTQWADGQPFAVQPTLSLDPAGRLVINAATGSTDQYDTNGINLLYSIGEGGPGLPPNVANPYWWLGPIGTKGAPLFHLGERVSGPMTVFNGTLFFSTYSAGEFAAGSTSCNAGLGKIWGLDFKTAASLDLSQGGIPELPGSATGFTPETTLDPTLAGAVIPGVSIRATPACANLGTGAADQYVPNAQHASPQSFTSGSFSLFTQVGKSTVNGASGPTPQLQIALPTPTSPTVIDSWAAVVQ